MTERNEIRGISRRDLMARAALIGAGVAVGTPVVGRVRESNPTKPTTGATTTCKPEDWERWTSRNWALGA